MPNIASVLKEEIARVARKEVRGETQRLKKASAQYRSDIAALKRELAALRQQLGRLNKMQSKKPQLISVDEPQSSLGFSAKGFAAQRQRLGLSASALATLLGISGQSVYKWEKSKARPRASQLPAIAGLRTMGKKEAALRLTELVA